jgi:hypothetical protein
LPILAHAGNLKAFADKLKGGAAVDDEFDDDFEADDDGFDDDDFDADHGDDEDEPTVECPYCGQLIHEEAERCPHCASYISAEDAPPARKPWWIIVGVVVCLYIVYRWIVGLAR